MSRFRQARQSRRSRSAALPVLLSLLLVSVFGVACGRAVTPAMGSTAATGVAPATSPHLTSTPLGYAFVAVNGSGFPADTSATVAATTPHEPSTVEGPGDGAVDVAVDDDGNLATTLAVPHDYTGPMTVTATAGKVVDTTTVIAGAGSEDDVAADAGVAPLGPVTCTTTADVGSRPSAAPGDTICLTGEKKSALNIKTGGTPGAPVVYSGGGTTQVQGINVTANNVVIEGFTSTDADSMGALLDGTNITFRDNTISHPVNTGDDTDGLHFFGNNISIEHNTIKDVYDGSHCDQNGCGDGPHPDCMQTFYSSEYPTSSDITIEGNRCQNAAAQCLIGEGPVIPDENVDGPGQSSNWVFYDNYCDDGADQAVQLKDIKNATIAGNDFEGPNNKAIALSDGSTGAHVGGNKLNPQIGELITFDDGQESPGYVGPTPTPDP
jgi:Right handed beta helix region